MAPRRGLVKGGRYRLPHAPRKGPVKLTLDDCHAIAQLQVEELKQTGVVEVVIEPRPWHSTRGERPESEESGE
jgi:hypothetical protein